MLSYAYSHDVNLTSLAIDCCSLSVTNGGDCWFWKLFFRKQKLLILFKKLKVLALITIDIFILLTIQEK
jgi:hypothetical protein